MLVRFIVTFLLPSGPVVARAPAEEGRWSRCAVERVQVEARLVAPKGGRGRWVVAGTATYHLGRPGGSVVLFDFATHLQRLPAGLDPVAERAFAAGPFEAARRKVTWVGAEVRTRTDGTVEVRPREGATRFQLRFELTVPRRPWPVGCVQGRCLLAGAIAPLPVVRTRSRPFLPAGWVVAPVRWRVHLQNPEDAGGVVILPPDGFAPYPTVVWGRIREPVRRSVLGIAVTIRPRFRRPSARAPDEAPLARRRDAAGRILYITRELAGIFDALGMDTAGRTLEIVQGPLRSTPARGHPGLVLVSDEAWEVVPTRRFLRFHDTEVARALATALWLDHLYRGGADPRAVPWLAAVLAEPVVAVWEALRAHADEDARDILRNLAFMPLVDRFIHSGQAAYADSYFRGSAGDAARALDPLRAPNHLPDGRFVATKLADTLPREAFERAVSTFAAAPSADPEGAFEASYGRRLDWFFDGWLAPLPRVDYAIASVHSEPDEGGGYDHRVVVRRRAERPLVEPVALYARDRAGTERYLVWNGEARPGSGSLRSQPKEARHAFTFHTGERLAEVRLDPRYRLHESPPPPRYNIDPRWNNRRPAAPRVLYTGAGLYVGAAEFATAKTPAARFSAVNAFAFFEASRRHDLSATGHLQVYHDRETWFGAAAGANLWGGPLANRRRRRRRVGFFQTVEWLSGRSLDPRGGVRLVETLSLVDDDRGFFMWPERGRRLEASVAARQTVRLGPPRDHRFDLLLRGTYVQLLRAAVGHVFAIRVAAALVAPLGGAGPEFRSLVRGGGERGLRSYTGNEIFGLGGAFLDAEYRHALVRNLHLGLLNLLWLREVGGVIFAGGASVSRCESLAGWFGPRSYYGQVGYGLYAKTYLLGISPQLLRIEVAVPLVRRRTTCLGRVLPDALAVVQGVDDPGSLLPSVAVNLQFVQPF